MHAKRIRVEMWALAAAPLRMSLTDLRAKSMGRTSAYSIYIRIADTFSRTCTGARVSDDRCLQNRSENQIYAVFVRQRFPSGIVGVGTVAVAHSDATFALSPRVCMHSLTVMRVDEFKCHVDTSIAKFEEELCEQRCQRGCPKAHLTILRPFHRHC